MRFREGDQTYWAIDPDQAPVLGEFMREDPEGVAIIRVQSNVLSVPLTALTPAEKWPVLT